MREDAPQRSHPLREIVNGLRWIARAGAPWRMMPNDLPPWEAGYQQPQRWLKAGGFEASVHALRMRLRLADGRQEQPSAPILESRPLQSSPESGHRAGDDGAKRKRGSNVHMAVDTLGHVRALHATPADEQDRAPVAQLTARGQDGTGAAIEGAFVDQGDTGDPPAQEAAVHGIHLAVVKRPEAKPGFVRRPRRRVVERGCAWAARCRRLSRDDERLPATLAGFHVLAFVILRRKRLVALMAQHA